MLLDQSRLTLYTPLGRPKTANNNIRALDSDEILAVYHDQDTSLKSIFDQYCKAGDRAGGPEALGVLLNIAEFRMILRDSGLLGGNNKVFAVAARGDLT